MGFPVNVNVDNEWRDVMSEMVQIAVVVFLLTVFVANSIVRVVRLKPRVSLVLVIVLLLVLVWQVWAMWSPEVDPLQLGPDCTVYADDSTPGSQTLKIIMFFDQPYGMLAEDHNRAYAARKGYAFQRHLAGCRPRKRAMQWAKIALLRLELERMQWALQWIVWIDADAVFVNHRSSLEEFLNQLPSRVQLVVGEDLTELNRPINTGWMAVRATPDGAKLLEAIWHKGAKMRKRWLFGHEQEALTELYRTRSDVQSMVMVDSKHVRMFSENDKTLRGDELVLHAAGWPREAKPRAIRDMIRRTVS